MKVDPDFRNGVTFIDLLGLAFIVLKLTGVIDWPWVWVTAPLWIYTLIISIVLIIIYIVNKKRRW